MKNAAIVAAALFNKCHEDVSRKGLSQPCFKPAVAVRVDPEESSDAYPVCAYHARGRMVLLAEIREAFNL